MRKPEACAAALLVALLIPFDLLGADSPASGTKDAVGRSLLQDVCNFRGAAVLGLRNPASRETNSLGNLGRDFLRDAAGIWSSPAHIDSRNILPIAGLGVATGLLIATDESVSRGFRTYDENHGWVRSSSRVITQMGSWGAYGTAGLFLAYGLVSGDKTSTETAILAANAMLQSEILVAFLKGMFGRQRPSYANGVDHWSGPTGFFERFEKEHAGYYDSFPSGHAITAFSLATVLAMQYRDTVWVPILSYTIATGVGLSRATLGKHWLSDAFVGGVLGHLIGRLVVRNHRRRYQIMPAAGLDHGLPVFAVTVCR